MLEMIDEYDIERDDNPLSYNQHNDALRQKCVDICNKLKGPSTTPSQSFTNPFKQQQVFQPKKIKYSITHTTNGSAYDSTNVPLCNAKRESFYCSLPQ
ncbi:MAG: hypothetical protein GY787_07610 [Alteromonadales bacterium]|nr:hypothetical protein [Alteromonadales bacterium]